MKSHVQTVLSGLAVFIFTLIINTVIDQIFAGKGLYQQTLIELDSKRSLATLRISNQTNQELKDIKILVPQYLSSEEIRTSLPISVEISKANISYPDQRLLTVSLVPANKTVTLLVPLKTGAVCCALLNQGESGLTPLDTSYSFSSYKESIVKGATLAFLYALIYIGLNLYLTGKFERNNEVRKEHFKTVEEQFKSEQEKIRYMLKESKADAAAQREETVELRAEANQLRKMYGYFKARTVKRINDYDRELNFWRDTVRKMLYQEGVERPAVEKVFDSITSNLKSYTTRKNVAADFETLEALAAMMVDDDKNGKDEYS